MGPLAICAGTGRRRSIFYSYRSGVWGAKWNTPAYHACRCAPLSVHSPCSPCKPPPPKKKTKNNKQSTATSNKNEQHFVWLIYMWCGGLALNLGISPVVIMCGCVLVPLVSTGRPWPQILLVPVKAAIPSGWMHILPFLQISFYYKNPFPLYVVTVGLCWGL